MTEGEMLSRTLEGGSESLFDYECTQCRAHGSRQEAADFCKDCKQFLCTTCGRYHIRNMTTHTLVSVASLSQTNTGPPTANTVPFVAKCHYHPDEDIEMYCGTHAMVYCCRCIAKEHRSCSDVNEIGDIAPQSSLSKLQSLVADITQVSSQLHTTKLERTNDLKQLKKKRASLLDEIKALRKKFNKQLDEFEQKIKAELDKEERKLEKDLGDDITTVDALIVASNNSKPNLTSHQDEKQMFISEKLGQAVLTDANTFLAKTNALKHPTLSLKPNDALCNAIEKSIRMGKIVRCGNQPPATSIQCSKLTVNSRNDINIRVTSDKTQCYINDMCELPDGTILMTDRSNNNLKRLDDQLQLKDWLALKGEPMGICSVSPTKVAVRLKDNTVHFIAISISLAYERNVSLNNFEYAENGMACCNNQLWIPGIKAVYVYTLSGSLVKKITTDSQGRKLFPDYNPHHIAVSNYGSKVYVAAWDDRVVVFNKNGDVLNELRDQRLNDADGLCITEDDIILATGWQSQNVVIMFARDDNSPGELVSRNDMLLAPRSLCYDRQKCRLLVGYTSDNVRVFQLS